MHFKKLFLICLILNSLVAKADISNPNNSWIKEINVLSKERIWKHLKEIYTKTFNSEVFNITPDRFDILNKTSGLYVFVSTSMSKNLLRNYLRESQKYGATLVFKGLPNNSFSELIEYLLGLVGEKNLNDHAISIDEELFEKFNIQQVPTIILVEEEEFNPLQKSKIIFDKIIGNVALDYALEKFGSNGDLGKEATKRIDDAAY